MLERLTKWDVELFVYLNNLGIEQYDAFWIFVTQIKHWVPLYILFFVLFYVSFKAKNALFASFATILTFLITFGFTRLVKNGVARIRPSFDEKLAGTIRVLQESSHFSFFSGHAASSFAVTTFVVLLLRRDFKWIYLAYVWPILFATSRIYVGVHYPSDVLVGALVGTLFAVVLYKLFNKHVPLKKPKDRVDLSA
ncbi:phosphatase PAP2 family protein [Gangjinia marincola]|uniref:Phosphatase PAP2 family protein n=1 Tax=Gangjinia marincola TaxID=578463 RepID=A0ABP3XYX5_9FLAO